MTSKRHSSTIEKISIEARRGKMSRRDFMQYAVAAGVVASSASSLWSTDVAAATPQKGGTFRAGIHDGNTSDTLDPAKFQSTGEIQLAHAVRSYLTEITAENGLGPDMADSWEASPDAKIWTFHLNKNATFHDGRKFTAKDAIASLNYHREEANASAAKPLVTDMEDITADGDHTIVITLSQGTADLPWIMTDYHLVMLPAKEGGGIEWESGIGAGPYKLENHEPGVQTDMVRHDGWHREGAYFDAVKFTILNDPNAMQAALLTGDVDSITTVDLKTMGLLARKPDVMVDNIPSGAAVTMPMFCDTAPYDNVDVRLALKYSINREDIIEKIRFGAATIGNDFHLSPNMPYFPDIEQRAYDPDKAKFHLKKAGMENLKVSLSSADSLMSGAVDMCVLFSEHAKASGIDLKAVREPNDGYWSDVWLKKPFVTVTWGARPTPDNMFTLAYKADADWNESHWKNARFNELLLQAKAELNDGLRAEMYNEMCQLSRDDGGTIIPLFRNYVYARNKKIAHGDSVASSWENDGGRAYHRWWMAS
jgi:peptide/nickel transport system substrate-binding protein